VSGCHPTLRGGRGRIAKGHTPRPVELFDQGLSDDAMGIPGWSDFQAARQRFLDRLAADAADRRRASPVGLPRPLPRRLEARAHPGRRNEDVCDHQAL
jgi:hypothetical protein